ncbi:MAG: hypothetical protein GXX80_12520 [Thermotogaceae bacterium]|jgi:hypothetical protein|nr:hypothetical protein [Thermotogaceae bacterium]
MKMERLKKYLDDVRTFLPGTNPKKVDEILREIESHVLERAEREHGEINDTAVAMTIKEYGSPEEVAARYYEGGPIIAPHLKNYLFMYTGILFAIHLGLHLIAFVFGENGAIFDFRGTDLLSLLSQLPVTFIFDFGLVSLILYFVTQAKATAKLPHFTYFIRAEKTPSMGKRIGALIGSLVGAGITFLAFTYGPFYLGGGELTEIAIIALDSFKFALFLAFGLLVIDSVSNLINIFNYSRFSKIVSNTLGLVFLFLAVSPDYKPDIASYLSLNPSSIDHPLLVAILFLMAIVIIVDLVFETIKFWASRIVRTN